MNRIKLSVIIPVYNQEELIIRALNSIPTRSDIEIIVIDDASTDSTFNTVVDYANKRPEKDILLLCNSVNCGVAVTVNKGIEVASGKYLVLLGSDDYFYTDAFEEVLDELEDYDLVFFDMKTNDGTIITSDEDYQPHGSVKFMRKSFVGSTRCPENKLAGEDYYFYKELLRKKPKVKYTHKVVKHYNYPREGSLSDLALKGELEAVVIKLTIIVPVYNQEDLIERALNSIPKRDDIEVLIVNDASTDSTLAIVNKWIKDNPDVTARVITHEINLGLGEAKNTGFDNARGEYVTQLDSDDYLYTEEYNKVIDKLDGTDMVYINLRINDGSIFFVNKDTQEGLCGGPARLIRREFLGDTRCPPLKCTEDWHLNNALQKKKHTDLFTNITAYHYNFPREGSLYDRWKKGVLKP